MTWRDVHVGWAWMVILANALAGVWCLAAWKLPSLRTRAIWWFVIAAEVTMFVQVGLGVAAMKVENLRPKQFHMLYGFAGLFFIALMYSYRPQLQRNVHMWYGFFSLFVMGLGIRAMLVGA